jgi:hypothetical protein
VAHRVDGFVSGPLSVRESSLVEVFEGGQRKSG